MITRLAKWWLDRKHRRATPQRVEECEVCGGPATHRIVSEGGDDEHLGISGGGGTFMAADFCAKHCPGGCRNDGRVRRWRREPSRRGTPRLRRVPRRAHQPR